MNLDIPFLYPYFLPFLIHMNQETIFSMSIFHYTRGKNGYDINFSFDFDKALSKNNGFKLDIICNSSEYGFLYFSTDFMGFVSNDFLRNATVFTQISLYII